MIQLLFLSSGMDADAQSFITATSITDAVQKSAINRLVVDLKAFGLWTKMHAVYPFAGGSSTTHRLNLKDPADSDAAYRLVYFGSVTHSATGVLPDGSSGCLDTNYNQNTHGALNNEHISVYLRTNTASTPTKVDMGVATSDSTVIIPKFSLSGTDTFGARSQATTIGSVANSDSRGFFSVSRTASTEFRAQRNSAVATYTVASSSLQNLNYYIGARNLSGSANAFSDREIAFASIGLGLSSTEMQNLYTAVQAFQTILGRQV